MKIAITGHTNIEKACGLQLLQDGDIYDQNAWLEVYTTIETNLKKYLQSINKDIKDVTFISGMARGIDEIWAVIAIYNNCNLILSIPNSISWHKTRNRSRGIRAQAIYYDWILQHVPKENIFEIRKDYNGETYPYANAARNQHMVDIGNGVFSFKAYDSTGTDDCIQRAKKQNKYISNLNQGKEI